MNFAPTDSAARSLWGLFRSPPLRDLVLSWPKDAGDADPPIRAITTSSRDVEEGSLFVALRGATKDGHDFVEEAVRKGAVAVVVEEEAGAGLDVPVVRVADSHRVLAELAADFQGRPADRLPLVGITGTLGKTSVLSILEAILIAAGKRPGVLGSLGLRVGGRPLAETGYTTPDPLLLHRALRISEECGCDVGAMEVTSHALDQQRVHGLSFRLGIFTNLVPLEHAEYHGTFRDYVAVKRRFLEHLADEAPLVYNADDRVVRRIVHDACSQPVGCGAARTATVRIEDCDTSARGTRFVLHIRRALPRLDGGEIPPCRLSLSTRLLGRSNLSNLALATTAALCLGVAPDVITATLETFPPPRRRLEVVHSNGFTVLDDTVGHPDSVNVVFEVAEALRPREVHVAFAVRGSRGARINRHTALALATWAKRVPIRTLVVTASDEAADERNRVQAREYSAFREPLRKGGIPFVEKDRLEDAVRLAVSAAGKGELVLLLGAQGMDDGAEIACACVAERGGG